MTAEREAAAYFAACMATVARAVARTGEIDKGVSAGHGHFKLVFAGPALVAATLRPLIRRFDPASRPATATWYVGDTVSSGIDLPTPPWSLADVTTVGFVPRFCVGSYRFAFDLVIGAVMGADLARGVGFQWLRAPHPLPGYLQAKPLRALFHWFLHGRGLRMTHAAAVGLRGRGALLTGRSGIGKSTTAVACAAAGMDFLGDDFVALEAGPPVLAHNIFASANLFPDNLARFPELALGSPLDPLEFTHPHLKAKHTIFVAECRPGAVADRLPVDAILVPVQGESGVVRIGAIEALRAVAPSTIILLPGEERDALKFFAQLCQAVPCYRIGVQPDMRAVPAAIRAVLEDMP